MEMAALYKQFKNSTGISTDTRTIEPGNLFFALKGDNFNGNTYVKQAFSKGAAFAIIDEEAYADTNTILVDDVLTTLQQLANYHRQQLGIPIIAITGSNGKTTTKELTHAVLSRRYNVFATRGNYNNHIGVPLSLLSLTQAHEVAIIEMGANHLREIAALCEIADPDFGLITNVGTAHIEGFGSQENIYIGKGEMYDYIRDNNKQGVFLCSDFNYLMDMAKGIRKITYGQKASFLHGQAIPGQANLQLTIGTEEDERTVHTQLVGSYNVYNALAAACVGRFFGLTLTEITEALEAYTPKNNRSQFEEFEGNQFILDAYNANPSSMQAALNHFHHIEHGGKIAILGDMLELGEMATSAHEAIVAKTKEMNIEQAYFVGPIFFEITQGVNAFPSALELKAWLSNQQLKDKLILLKGSRGIQLESAFNFPSR